MGCDKMLECKRDLEYNPLMQKQYKATSGHVLNRTYAKPLCFNRGFVPQTWSNDDFGGDGCPIDLVDVSRSKAKSILTVSDYLVLGVLGLVNRGRLDYKIIALDMKEAQMRNISTLN